MAILRIQKKDRNFLMLEKTCIEDKRLSWKAKGLHTYLMGLPDNWTVSVPELSKHATDGEESIYSGLRELINKGYVKQSMQRGQGGRFLRGDYMVYEKPQAVDIHQGHDTSTRTETMVNLQESVASDDEPILVKQADLCGGEESFQAVVISPELQKPAPESTHRVYPEQEYPHRENPDVDQPSSGNPELINININNYLNNKNTTTEEILGIVEPKAIPQLIAAVGYKKINQEDLLIEKTLKPTQLEQVHDLASALFAQKKYPMDPSALEVALQTTLLDPRSFTQAGNDFLKKFNTLKKCMREGKWIPPIPAEKAKVKAEVPPQVQHEQRYRELDNDLQYWKRLLMGAIRDGKEALQVSMSRIVEDCEQKIALFKQNSACTLGAVALH